MVAGILFDKDGTLFDFRATSGPLVRALLLEFAGGRRADAWRLGDMVGFDFATMSFMPHSVIIAGTAPEVAEALLPAMQGWSAARLIERMNSVVASAPQVEATPLVPLLAGLIARGLRLGVVTNDAEAPTEAQLMAAGIRGAFEFVAGYDSGYGAKPEPGMLNAFVRRTGLAPGAVVMVGDSRHDLLAGRAAGMRTVGVLTGVAGADDLAGLADVVLSDISALPAWLASPG